MSASTCSPPRPALITIGPPSAPSRASLPNSRPTGCRASRRSAAGGRRGYRCGRETRRAPARPHSPSTPGSVFGVRLQPATWKPSRTSSSAAAAPRTPRPITPTRTSDAAGWRSSRQRRSRLEPEVAELLAVMEQHLEHHPFGHPPGQVVADDAGDRHVRQAVDEDDMLDAGAEREDRLEVGQGPQRRRRRMPRHQVADRVRIGQVRPDMDIAPRCERAHRLRPGLRLPVSAGDQDAVRRTVDAARIVLQPFVSSCIHMLA